MNAKDATSGELQSAVRDLISAKGLAANYQPLFMEYLDTGRLSNELTDLCERDEHCREALEIVFDAQLKAIQEGRPERTASDQPPTVRRSRPQRMAGVAAAITEWLPTSNLKRLAEGTAAVAAVFVAGMAVGIWLWPSARQAGVSPGHLTNVVRPPEFIVNDDRVFVRSGSFEKLFPGDHVSDDGYLVRVSKDDVDVRAVQMASASDSSSLIDEQVQSRIWEILSNDRTLDELLHRETETEAATAATEEPEPPSP